MKYHVKFFSQVAKMSKIEKDLLSVRFALPKTTSLLPAECEIWEHLL